MILNRTYHVKSNKSHNQFTSIPRVIKNNSPTIYTTWYPSARPLQHYRKQGAYTNHNTDVDYNNTECDTCDYSKRVGKTFDLLGKKDDGDIKDATCQKGTIISFSGNATIKPSTTIIHPNEQKTNYYSNYYYYLKSRGNVHVSKSSFHKIPGVDYTVTPNNTDTDSTHFYQNAPTIPKCNTTIYKPSNPSFSTQGPVDGSTYIARQKFNAITNTNASFVKSWGVRMTYNENPLFFAKNKYNKCTNSSECYPS
jgi:hypothetical protein